MTMFKRRHGTARAWIPAVGGLVAVALAVAGCGGSSSSSGNASAGGNGYGGSSASSKTAAPAAPTSGSARVALRSTNLGKVLVNGQGQTLYLFQADKGTASTCFGGCAQAWPPLTTTGKPTAGAGVSAAKLGTTKRSDGMTEVTYNGHPLYLFVGDHAPGQTTGEESTAFGAEWDVLSAAGNKITQDSH